MRLAARVFSSLNICSARDLLLCLFKKKKGNLLPQLQNTTPHLRFKEVK